MKQPKLLEKKQINNWIAEKTVVSVFLKNGIKLTGIITEMDENVIILKATLTSLIYKSAISTILPEQPKTTTTTSTKKISNKNTKRKIII